MINYGRKACGGEYLGRILCLVVPVQEFDMLRDNVAWISAPSKPALKRERGEQNLEGAGTRIPSAVPRSPVQGLR